MGFLKTFAKDMLSTGKTAARGMWNLADMYSDDPKVRKRAIAERKKMDQEQKQGYATIPEHITYNKHGYDKAGTFGNNLTDAKKFALKLEKDHGFKTVVKRIKSLAFGDFYAVYYRERKTTPKTVTVTKAKKSTKANPKVKKVLKTRKSRSADWW